MPYEPGGIDPKDGTTAFAYMAILIGAVQLLAMVGIAIAHYGYGVPVYQKRTREEMSDGGLAVFIGLFVVVDLGFIALGRYLLRQTPDQDD